jgi:hypothetical protein
MCKRHQLVRFSLLLGWLILTCGVGIGGLHTVAHAAASFPPGYALTLTESIATMTYGGAPPTFQAQLTVPAGEIPVNPPNQFSFLIDAHPFGSDSNSSVGTTYYFNFDSNYVASAITLSAGQHSVVASYFSSVLNQTLTSAPVTVTVQKFTPTITCQVNGGYFLVNSPIAFSLSAQNGPAIDWQDATYSITFVGSQTFTQTNLSLGSSGQVTATTPPVPGNYSFQCTFNGTANFNAAQSPSNTGVTLLVSQGHQPGISLYSNPTTITAGQTVTVEIVISGERGLPTPTGGVALFLGPYNYTNVFRLGADGSVTQQILFPSPLPSTTLQVNYTGDAVYAQSSATFSLTNPPISGGSNPPPPTATPAPRSTASSALTPTPSGSSTPVSSSTPASSHTPAASSTTIANGGTTAGSHPPAATSTQGTLVFWIVLVVLLLLAAGGSGGFIVLRKRARAAQASATTTLPLSEEG